MSSHVRFRWQQPQNSVHLSFKGLQYLTQLFSNSYFVFLLLPGWGSWRRVVRQRGGTRRDIAQVDPQGVHLGTDQGQGRKRESEGGCVCVEAGLYTVFPKLQEYHLLTISFLRGLCSTLGKSGNWLKSCKCHIREFYFIIYSFNILYYRCWFSAFSGHFRHIKPLFIDTLKQNFSSVKKQHQKTREE